MSASRLGLYSRIIHMRSPICSTQSKLSCIFTRDQVYNIIKQRVFQMLSIQIPFECLALSCFCQQMRIFHLFPHEGLVVFLWCCGHNQGLFSYYFLITFSLDADLQSWTERVENNFSYNKTSSDGIYPLPTPPWPMVVSGEERRSIQHCFGGRLGREILVFVI